MSHTAATSMTRYFERGRGKAISISMLGFPFGEALLPPIAVAANAALGWRTVWLAIGGLLLLVLVPLMLWLLRGHEARHDAFTRGFAADASQAGGSTPRRPATDWTANQVLRDPRFWQVVPVIVAAPFLMTGFFFHQVHLVETKGWAMGWYSLCFAAFAAASVAASIVSGPLVDRHGARRALPFFSLPMAAGLLVLASFGHPMTAPSYLVLAGLTAGSGGPIAGALWAEAYGATHLGAIRSTVSAFFVLSTAASPVLMGRLIDRGVTMETLAIAGAAYTVAATALGAAAFRKSP
jgi:predicted MFS family arabinose efflux permease